MLEKQLGQLPPAQRDMIMTAVNENPDFFKVWINSKYLLVKSMAMTSTLGCMICLTDTSPKLTILFKISISDKATERFCSKTTLGALQEKTKSAKTERINRFFILKYFKLK